MDHRLEMMSSLSNRVLIRILTANIRQPALNRRPSTILRCQFHSKNELYRERNHCLRSGDMIAYEIPAIARLQLCLQPVKILDHILLEARSQLFGIVASMRRLYTVGRQWTIKVPSASWMYPRTLMRWAGSVGKRRWELSYCSQRYLLDFKSQIQEGGGIAVHGKHTL